MPATKISYKNRIPTVIKIIEEAKEPIEYTELHSRLIKETGVKLSKHTLNKCLEQLYTESRIKKSKEKGVGGPVKYSMNIVIPTEHITEDHQWKILDNEISGILYEFILAFYAYSFINNRKEFEDCKDRIEITRVPRIFEIQKLVKRPVIISKKPTETLSKELYKSFRGFRNKVFHMYNKITKEEYEKICHLIREELGELYLDTGDPDYLLYIK